jgi:hypothetical protein
MGERGIDKPGWLLKQFADLERESEKWPERMKRAVAEKVLESSGIDPEQVGKEIRAFAWETMQAAARREGVIEGLEWALNIAKEYPFTHVSNEIRDEIERLRKEK